MLDATFNAKHTHTTRGACDVACFIMCDMNRENENDMWWKSEIRTITVAWDRQRKKQIRLLILMSNCNKIESRRHITAWLPRLIELYCYVCVNTRKLSSRNDVCASRTFKSSRHRRRYLIQHIYLSYIHAWFLVFSLSLACFFSMFVIVCSVSAIAFITHKHQAATTTIKYPKYTHFWIFDGVHTYYYECLWPCEHIRIHSHSKRIKKKKLEIRVYY